jgi:hypothetical protein
VIDWHGFDLRPVAAELRETSEPADAEKMIWALEKALAAGRLDDELLDYLLAATVCLLAARSGQSPRTVLEGFFRRSVSDQVWHERFRPLFA